MQPCVIIAILQTFCTCLYIVSLPMQASVASPPFSNESKAELRGEEVREALRRLVNAVQPVWAHPPVCVCVFLCVGVFVQMCSSCVCVHVSTSVCIYVLSVCVCVFRLADKSNPPPSGAMWVDWLVSTSWTFLTLSLLLPGELPTYCLHWSCTLSVAPLDSICILLWARLNINIEDDTTPSEFRRGL